ncbi:MAG TPA: ABC transporter substrate-binding protein [Burkholderiaceae bacterium]|nr:ABC transporter substrate-binding protein [Burkholderiaceae bacterium]
MSRIAPRGHRAARICAGILLSTLALAMPGRAAQLTLAITHSPSTLAVDVAVDQGYFAAEGVAVRVVECGGGPLCMQQLFDREVQMTAVSELPVVFNSFQRSDYAIVATLATSTGNIKLIGRKSAGITGPQQLVGKRIGVIVGSSSHYFLDAYLLFHGIDPKQVQIVDLQAEQMTSAVERGQIDALAAYGRHVAAVAKTLGTDALALDDPRIYTDSHNLIVERRTLAEREDDIVRVLRALQRAQTFIAERPQRAKEILCASARLDPAFVDTVFSSFSYRLSLDHSLVSTMEGEARWAVREGHVRTDRPMPNYLDYVAPGPLLKAVPAALQR